MCLGFNFCCKFKLNAIATNKTLHDRECIEYCEIVNARFDLGLIVVQKWFVCEINLFIYFYNQFAH